MSFIKSALKAIGITLVVIFTLIVLLALAIPSEEEVEQAVNETYQDYATDVIAQYEMTKQHGTAIDQCLAAQQVAAAYLHANSTDAYATWKDISGAACRAAGLSY